MKKFATLILIISNILFTTGIFLYSPPIAFATDSGPNSPGTVADDASVGTQAFDPTSINEVKVEDGQVVLFDGGGNQTGITHYLKVTNFGFSIPSGATIDGIKVEIKRYDGIGADIPELSVVDNIVKLVVGGTVSGDNKASATTWPGTLAYATYGGAADKWGLSLTEADIESSTFGMVISATIRDDYDAGVFAFIDHIRITVSYTESGGGSSGSLTTMSDTMNNQNASGYSTHLIKFRTPSAIHTTGNTIVVTFPSDFDFTDIVIGEITMKDGPTTGLENTEALSSSPSGTDWGAVFSGTNNRILTLTAPTDGVGAHDIIANDYITLAYASTHSKNATTTGSKIISITTTSDAGSLAVPIITTDQVTLDAIVAPTITFTNDATSLHFGILSSSAVQYADTTADGSATDVAGNTFTISTNATSGYTLNYAAAATLTSGANTIDAATISADANGTPGTEQFGMSAAYTNGSGGGTITAAYDHTSVADWKFTTDGENVITTTGPVDSDTVEMHYLANIAATTPAGLYTQTNTWIATGNF